MAWSWWWETITQKLARKPYISKNQRVQMKKYVLYAQTNLPPNLELPRWTHLQPDRSLLDRRKTLFWRQRCYGAEGCKHRFRPHASHYKTESKNMPCQQNKTVTTEMFRSRQARYYDELESELQGVQTQPLSLDEKCKKLEETIQRVATNTIGFT
jgi:hypothetical protein